jgi:hypothetical protein
MTIRRDRRPHRSTGLAAILGAILLTTAHVSAVSAHGPDPTLSTSLFSQDQKLGYRWRSGSEPPAAVKTAIKAAATGLNGSRASRAATFTYDASGASWIGYGAGATCGVNGIACFTRTAPTSFTMWLREQGHVFDWGTLKWCQTYASPPNGCYDATTIALDEFGHVEVLGHHANYSDDRDYLDAVVQTYSRTKAKAGWDEHVLGRCDVATLQRVYDVPSSTTKISTCLDLDTTASLAVSSTGVTSGTTVAFDATLKVASSSAYGRLSGNALSNRTVLLQRRNVGATTWSTVATMTAGPASGTYTATYKISAAGQFRARFSTPSGEGLTGDSSPTITVSVVSAGCAGQAGSTETSVAGAPCL